MLDQIFSNAHSDVFKTFNCLNCANCCKNYSPIIEPDEINVLSIHDRIDRTTAESDSLVLDRAVLETEHAPLVRSTHQLYELSLVGPVIRDPGSLIGLLKLQRADDRVEVVVERVEPKDDRLRDRSIETDPLRLVLAKLDSLRIGEVPASTTA
jgi:hypothetical protein